MRCQPLRLWLAHSLLATKLKGLPILAFGMSPIIMYVCMVSFVLYVADQGSYGGCHTFPWLSKCSNHGPIIDLPLVSNHIALCLLLALLIFYRSLRPSTCGSCTLGKHHLLIQALHVNISYLHHLLSLASKITP